MCPPSLDPPSSHTDIARSTHQVVLRVEHSLHATWARDFHEPEKGEKRAMVAMADEVGGGGELSDVLLQGLQSGYGQREDAGGWSEDGKCESKCGLDAVLKLVGGVESAREWQGRDEREVKTGNSNVGGSLGACNSKGNASHVSHARGGVLENEKVRDVVERSAAQVCMS
jgi:hypothetical protein